MCATFDFTQVSQKELDATLDTISAYQMELRSTLEVTSLSLIADLTLPCGLRQKSCCHCHLQQLEDDVDKMYETQGQIPDAADIEREQTFQLAVDIGTEAWPKLSFVSIARFQLLYQIISPHLLSCIRRSIKRNEADAKGDSAQAQQYISVKRRFRQSGKRFRELISEGDRRTLILCRQLLMGNQVAQILKILNVHHNSLQWIEDSTIRLNKEVNDVARRVQQMQ